MKTLIALLGVVLGGATILTGAVLAVWNLAAGLAVCAAAILAIVAAAWHIERTDVLAELALLRAENKALKTALGAAHDEMRRLRRDLAAEKTTVEDLRAQQRRAVEHLRVCPTAQAVAEEDQWKARSNR